MEYGVSPATLSASKKLPNGLGCGFSGKSAYAGVFSTPVKFKSPALPSRVEDYSEIFGVSEAARGPSIPTLEVPALNERNISTAFRHSSSKLDYSKVFGGLGDADTVVSYTELLGQPKRKTSLPKQERVSAKRRSPSKGEDVSIHVSNDPLSFQEASCQFDGPKKISVSYNKINQGDRNGAHSTTHISQLHAVPVYTCLVDEISSLKVNRANKYERSVPNVAHGDDSDIDIVQERKACHRANTITHTEAKTQCPTSSMKVHKSDRGLSNLNTKTFNGHAIDNGMRPMNMSPPETLAHDSDKRTSNFKRSENKSQVSSSDISERGNGTYSPPELADFMNFNSEAAASVAALKKAMDEAQEKFKAAKESTWRRKEGLKDRVKIKFNDELKGKNVDSVANRIHITKEIKPQTIREEMTDSVQILSERQMAAAGVVAADLIDRKIPSVTEEDVTEMMQESKTTHRKSKLGEMGLKQEDIFYEFADTGRSDEPKSEFGQFYQFVDRGKSEEAELNSEQFADKVITSQATDVENNHGNDFNCLEEDRMTVKVVDKDLRRDKTVNDFDPGNGPCEHENFKREFGSVQNMQNHEGNKNLVNLPEKQNGLEKKLDLLREHEEYESTVIKFLQSTEKNCISQFLEKNEKSIEVSLAEQREKDLRILGKSVIDEKIPAQVLKENVANDPCGIEEPQERIGDDTLPEPQELHLNLDSQIEPQNQIKNGGGTSILDEDEEHQDYTCKDQDIVKIIDNVYEDKIVEKTVDHIRANKENGRRHGGDDNLDENKMVVEDKNDEDMLNTVTTGMTENREWKGTSEWEAAGRNCKSTLERNVDENTNVLEDYTKHVNYNDERLNLCELDETEIQHNISESTIFSQKEENIVDKELSDELGDGLQATKVPFQSKENCERSETVQRRNNLVDTVLDETAERTINMPAEQNEDQCVDVADTLCNLREIDEATPNIVNFSNNTNQNDVSVHEDVEENLDTFSSERMVGTKNYVEVTANSSTLSEQKPDINELHEIETSKNGEDVKENDQTTKRVEEKKTDSSIDNLLKVELEKERLRKIEEAREREREKEKLAVERAIREARERAFADARERAEKAAMERATAKVRHRMTTETQEKLGKNCNLANDKSFVEKSALEVKLKAERAAVERATAEARARALERAMSEKALSEERNKDAQHSSSWSSRTFRHSRSSTYGATHSSEDLDGDYGESAQRCKARSERHQRVMERAAKALAEKSMRDHLAQKEQEERNRLAEALDADIKRWSSGKEGNLRALLSTLHYILGSNSGWQPIPMTDMVTGTAVKKAYRKATLFVHPDKLQQRGASIQQKYTCEKVFDLLKEAWNRLNVEER